MRRGMVRRVSIIMRIRVVRELRGTRKLRIYIIFGLAEFTHRLAQPAGQFRKFFCAEEEQHHEEDEEAFRPRKI